MKPGDLRIVPKPSVWGERFGNRKRLALHLQILFDRRQTPTKNQRRIEMNEAWLDSFAEFAIAEQHRKLTDRLLFERDSAILYLASLERDRINLKQQGIEYANENAIDETAANIVALSEAINMVRHSPDMVPYDFVRTNDAYRQENHNILKLVRDAARTVINADRRDLSAAAGEQRLIAQYKKGKVERTKKNEAAIV